MSGANYWISCLQILQSERRIKSNCLLRFTKDPFNGLSADGPGRGLACPPSQLQSICSTIMLNEELDISDAELSSIYLLAGYSSRSVCHRHSCLDLLVCSSSPVPGVDVPNICAQHFLAIDRGGLTIPSGISFVFCILFYFTFESLKNSGQLLAPAFLQNNARKVFYFVCRNSIYNSFYSDLPEFCDHGHDVCQDLCVCIFNTLAKTWSKTMIKTSGGSSHTADQQKIRKLRSSVCK